MLRCTKVGYETINSLMHIKLDILKVYLHLKWLLKNQLELGGGGRAGYFTFIVILMSGDSQCSVALPRETVGWSAVCDCSISWPYSLAFWSSYLLNVLS